jgi:hypothetical protein
MESIFAKYDQEAQLELGDAVIPSALSFSGNLIMKIDSSTTIEGVA